MEFIVEFKNKHNHYCEKIKDSVYFELRKQTKQGFQDICEIFINHYETDYSILNENEKIKYLITKKLEIASLIDNIQFKELYNTKFSKKIITSGLQSTNKLSSILYLNEHYKCNCIIYNVDTNKYYQTSLKNYPKIYCEYKHNTWFPHDNIEDINILNDINDLQNIIHMDISTIMIYKPYLKSLSIYKLKELQDIASELNISFINHKQKKKTKQELYNEINLKQI